jgi:UDP-N-acetylmuramate--alanine ligase
MFANFKTIHLVGIGGVGMSGIAEVLHNLGYEVTGSDLKESETTKRLMGLGIKIHMGHSAENIGNAHVIVISSAVRPDNPEVVEARKRGIPVIPRAEMLAELGRLKYAILIAGAHGKTTTTSVIATLLSDGGLDPTVVIGGRLNSMGTNAKLGQGEFLVAEADESDGSFLRLNPTVSVITNIDNEHLDFFGNIDNIKRAFVEFIGKTPFYGFSVLCLEDAHIREIIPLVDRKKITYGLTSQADVYAHDIKELRMSMSFDVIYRDRHLGNFTIPMPGIHNVLNSLAGIVTAYELNVDIDLIRRSLMEFKGIQRRLQLKGSKNGILIYDDYGHHPNEIKATIKAIRGSFKTERLNVIFQPHRYSRTNILIDDFADAFWDADRVYVLDIYPAGEMPIDGVSSHLLIHKMQQRGFKNVFYIDRSDGHIDHLISELKEGEVVLTLGAGDVYKVGEELLARLGKTP